MGMPKRAKYCLPWYSKRSTWFRSSPLPRGAYRLAAPTRLLHRAATAPTHCGGRPLGPARGAWSNRRAARQTAAGRGLGPTCRPAGPGSGRGACALPALALVEGPAEPLADGGEGSAGREHLGDPHVLERRDVGLGDDAADDHEHVAAAAVAEPLDDLRDEGEVGAREEGEAHGVGVLLDDRLDDLVGRLMQPRVDDLEPRVAQRPGDDLGAAVVAVEPRLGHDDSVRPDHGRRY